MFRARAAAIAIIAITATGLLGGCGSSSGDTTPSTATTPKADARFFAPLPPVGDVLSLVRSAGLDAEKAESLQHHVHAHLDIFVNGDHKFVPGGVGIVTTDKQVHHAKISGFDAYGGIGKPCSKPCISPLHTHDATGTLHTESAIATDNTLGQFFKEWDVKLDASCVGDYCAPDTPIMVYVDGKPVTLDKAGDIALTDQTEIAIVIGKSPADIPSTPDFGG